MATITTAPPPRLRYGSIVAQLENDRFNVDEGTETDRAYRRGWNCAIGKALTAYRIQRAMSTMPLDEQKGDEKARAFGRGHNAGLRHVLDLMQLENGLRELAVAPVIRPIEPIDFRLKEALIRGSL